MTVLHTGSTEKFASGWETIFGRGQKSKAAKKASSVKPAARKKPAKKKSATKRK